MLVSQMTRRLLVLFIVVASFSPIAVSAQEASPVVELPEGVTVVASGLTAPRGFTWGADGELYLALAGTGGEEQVAFDGTPVPFFVGDTASIVTVADGCTTPVVEGISSILWSEADWVWGVMDVAILDGELYALLGGGSTPDAPNGIYRVLADGTVELVADLATWSAENPTTTIPPDDDPAGSWFDLEAGEDRLWVSEAVRGNLVTVTPDGEITRIADLSEGHMVPTGIALAPEGGAYLTYETVVPYPDGASKVVHVHEDGTVEDVWTGLTAVTDLVIGPDGTLYAAEMATNNLDEPPYLNPNSGRVVRQTGPDSLEPVVTDADYPVMLGFDDAGDLYVTYPAFGMGTAEGEGALIAIDLDAAPVSLADLGDLGPSCDAVATPQASPVAGTMEVIIDDFAFSPDVLEIPAGTTVTWTNEESVPHTVENEDGVIDSGMLNEGDSFSFTFDEPGTFAYICGYHPSMTATIVVV